MNKIMDKKDGIVAYVIVSWNNQDLIRECIESIQAQDYEFKRVILVDNDSKDDTVSYVENNFSEVEILTQKQNQGFARGNNIGIEYALQDENVQYIVLLNTDARLKDDWTSTLVNFAERTDKAATLQTITLDYYDHQIIDSTHIYVSHNGQGTQGSYRRPINDDKDVLPRKVFGCNAAAILITRDFIEVQPFKTFFDEAFFMYLEDVDIAARASVMGWGNYIVPGSRAYHMGSASSGKNPGFSLYMTFRNNSRLLLVNLPLLMLLRMLPSIIKGDMDTVRHLKIQGKEDAAKKVIRGRIRGLIKLPLAIPRAFRMRLAKKISTSALWELMEKGY
jgi:GT2 family glycosyltransferase